MSLKIAVVGSGYVGLVSGACFADFGHSVVCVDIDPGKVQQLQQGDIPIFEPGLDDLVQKNQRAGRLSFTTDLVSSVASADVVFIAVGTPSRRGDGHADLTFVYNAARSIAGALTGYTVVVTKSTVPVGTGDEVERLIRETNPGADFSVVSSPEFLREGAAISDFRRPDRVVIGAEDDRAIALMEEVYRPLSLNAAPLMVTDRRTSELIKYAGNAFLAMKITFINEIADLCERVGADVQAVARGIGADNRIGPKFLNVGPGYGGSCFPKDTMALVRTGVDHGVPLNFVETTVAVNDARKRAMAQKVIVACGGNVDDLTIGVLGLTFKPDTDDVRESPALTIIRELQCAGARIRAFDPEGMEQARQELDDVEYVSDSDELARDADCLVLVTEWNEFRNLDLERVRRVMREPILVDLRNAYRRSEVEAAGFAYASLGRRGDTFDDAGGPR